MRRPAFTLSRFLLNIMTVAALGFGCSDSQSPTAPGAAKPTPAPPAGEISGTWIGTYKTNDNIDCDPGQVLKAQATFQQNGSTVTGTLSAPGPCGLGYAFTGTFQGSTLSGDISATGFGGGTANGTLSSGSLIINAFNMYDFNMGQMQLHR